MLEDSRKSHSCRAWQSGGQGAGQIVDLEEKKDTTGGLGGASSQGEG